MDGAFSANPFQGFADYPSARRAAQGAGVVALLVAAQGLWVLAHFVTTEFHRVTILMLFPGTLLTLTMFILGWRILVRPGPFKVFAILAFATYDVIALILGFSNLNGLFVINVAILGVTLNFCLIAFRGALAMKRFQVRVDPDVFD